MNKTEKIKQLFEKKIYFENNENFELPDKVFAGPKWSLPSFQWRREELNRVKSLLNEYDLEEWSRHTKHRDPSSYIMRFVRQRFHPELVTQAWCKFYECLSSYPLISEEAVNSGFFTSVHLCEAPGAFVSALNHYMVSHGLNLTWDWHAVTLNPDHEGNSLLEMIPDDRLLRHTYPNWYFGDDMTGNIVKYHNHVGLLEKTGENVWLVTADGSIDCSSDPGNQERHVEFLHYCETLTALALLRPGGTFVLKIFTMFEDSTICLLYLLAAVFAEVSVFKPASSKGGNSELYVVCLRYKGFSREDLWKGLLEPYKNGKFEVGRTMFELEKIDKDFLRQLVEISDNFTKKQMKLINENISYFGKLTRVHRVKVEVANRYISKYKLKAIPQNRRLVSAFDVSNLVPTTVSQLRFFDGVFELRVANFDQNLDDVQLGERISQIKSSRFCHPDMLARLSVFRERSPKSTSFLYKHVEKKLSKNCNVIGVEDFTCGDHHEFQRQFFRTIFSSKQSHFLLVRVPLLTNFLVGLIYVVASACDKVCFHKSGFVLLYNFRSQPILDILECIHMKYKNFDGEVYCRDVVTVVHPNQLYNNNFFDFIWNYNNIISKYF